MCSFHCLADYFNDLFRYSERIFYYLSFHRCIESEVTWLNWIQIVSIWQWLKGNLDRIQKEAQVKELNSIFNKMTAGVLIDYRGIEANQIVELRKKLNESWSTMKVIMNSLARIASNDTPFAELAE